MSLVEQEGETDWTFKPGLQTTLWSAPAKCRTPVTTATVAAAAAVLIYSTIKDSSGQIPKVGGASFNLWETDPMSPGMD